MKGKIELYSNYGTPDEELLYDTPNTVVDGAGEVLVDLMTAHSSLSGIPDLSSILDTSNYTIQAISFGKDTAGYNLNAHEVLQRKGYGAFNQPSRIVLLSPQDDMTLSSYDPSFAGVPSGVILPSFVTPRQTELELNALTSGSFYAGATLINLDVCAPGINNVGHNINTIAYAAELETAEDILKDGFGGLFGCYPDGSGAGGTEYYVVSSEAGISQGAAAFTDVIYSGVYNSLFNNVSSMDTSGFVDFVGSSTVDAELAAGWSGLTVSADTTGADHLSATGEIAYKVVIGSGDVGAANLYGGIYNLGLWAMDLCAAEKYNNPPLAFHPITNQKRYKLFSKKSLLDNLCRTKDGTGPSKPGCERHADLTLIWRLYFI